MIKNKETEGRLKYPLYRGPVPKSADEWLEKKRLHDNTEGLWRVHDNFYDLTNFVNLHPGGAQWIASSKGTDITEAFETHHLKGTAETTLPKYFVRKAIAPRNQDFTFEDDGFYRTLKSKVVSKLLEIPQGVRKKSDRVTDSLLIAVVVLSPLSCLAWRISAVLGALAVVLNSFVLSYLVTSAHSYVHRADNWRMYLFNLNGQCYEDWRITHSLSHHLFTNTSLDAEISLVEPLFQLLPYKDKPLWAQLSVIYWPVVGVVLFTKPLWRLFLSKPKQSAESKTLKWSYTITFFIPLWMLVLGGQTFLTTISLWTAISFLSSFYFVLFGSTAGHLTPKNYFEGDLTSQTSVDWGIHQLNTTMERSNYIGQHFKSITRFGDHVLHHLFPTLDQAELFYLYPVFLEHCKEFGVQLRTTTFIYALADFFLQIIRKGPNKF